MARRDEAHRDTDREIERIEKRLKKEYSDAYESMKKDADKYFASFSEREQKMLDRLAAGEITEADLTRWKTREMLHGKRYDNMVKGLAEDMTKTNLMARDIVSGHMADIYANNYNFAAYEICKDSGIDIRFDLADPQTVKKLATEDGALLPKGKVNVKKDLAWNEKKIRSAMTQGIIRGDSVDKMAANLRQVSDMSRDASIRNARTMSTSAENAGRMERYKEAESELGIEMMKTWVATLDDRTRDAHIELDGVTIPIDQDFKNSVGRISYPADPDADPENVYNCRCTLISSIKGHPRDMSGRVMSDKLGDLSYSEWKKQAEERVKEKAK